MQNHNDQRGTSGNSRNVKIAVFAVVGITSIGVVIGFMARRSLIEIQQLATICFVVGFALAFFLWWMQRQSVSSKSRASISTGNMLFGFVLGIGIVSHAAYRWTTLQNIFFDPFILIAVILLTVATNIRRYRSWRILAFGIQDLHPNDEREERIVSVASQVSFVITIILIVAAATAIQIAPMPTKSATIELLVGTAFLATSLREFVAWRMGLK